MEIVSTGTAGLDTVLQGGLPRGASVIVEGAPGTGKTTLAVQYLVDGTERDEPGIYITFEELPEQIYSDMLAFGWNLRELEKKGLLRVVCMSPETFLNQLIDPVGLIERMVQEIGCRRIVIDSISLYRDYGSFEEPRRPAMYQLRSALRRLGLTSFLLREESEADGGDAPFENFMFDGIIRLKLKPYHEQYRIRTLEVLKMRGRPVREGEHIYRITSSGIYVLPVRSMLEDVPVRLNRETVPTGIARLDEQLSGGIPRGTIMMLDTNSKANYKYLVISIMAQRIKAGDQVIAITSSINTPADVGRLLALHGVSLEETVAAGGIYFIEHYKRVYPLEIEPSCIDVSDMDNDAYSDWQRDTLYPLIRQNWDNGKSPFIYYDLSTVIAKRGRSYLISHFTSEAAWIRAYGASSLVMANFTEIGTETASFLERTSHGVIRTWVDGSYQFLQITKSPNGQISEPLLVEKIAEAPFIRLI